MVHITFAHYLNEMVTYDNYIMFIVIPSENLC
jgi:hypothetical protein